MLLNSRLQGRQVIGCPAASESESRFQAWCPIAFARSLRRGCVTGRDGTTLVIRHGASFEVLATNTLDDGFGASAALADNHIYLRGYRHLYAIAAPPARVIVVVQS